MIIRDSRSPRGRFEQGPPNREFDRLMAIAVGPVLPENTTWRDLNKRVDQQAVEKGRRELVREKRQYHPQAVTTKTCLADDCQREFEGVVLRLYCSTTCRNRIARRRFTSKP